MKVPLPLSPTLNIVTQSDAVFERFSYRNVQNNSDTDISSKRNRILTSNDYNLTNDIEFQNSKQDQPISSLSYLLKIQQRSSSRQ